MTVGDSEGAWRIIDSIPSREEQLAAEITVTPADRAALRAGAALFDAGRYWDAHEAWEEIWQRERRPIRSFYQGLIQVAAALHHWTVKHNPVGVSRLLEAGADKLAWYRPAYLGVDVERLLAEAQRLQGLASDRDAAWLRAFPPRRCPNSPGCLAARPPAPPRARNPS